MGKSVLGRLTKGWGWDHLGQTGQQILNALELASPYSWALAESDLFDPNFRIFDPGNVLLTVMVGTAAYDNALRATLHEDGTDGTVRVSTANLKAHLLKLSFEDPAQPKLTVVPRNCPPLAFAVFNRDHTAIHDPFDTRQADCVFRALSDSDSNVCRTGFRFLADSIPIPVGQGSGLLSDSFWAGLEWCPTGLERCPVWPGIVSGSQWKPGVERVERRGNECQGDGSIQVDRERSLMSQTKLTMRQIQEVPAAQTSKPIVDPGDCPQLRAAPQHGGRLPQAGRSGRRQVAAA